jgi:hypothetical protein
LPRLIVFLLIAYIVYSLLKPRLLTRKTKATPQPPAPDEEDMVFDPQCQSYLPKKDAVSQGDKFFCSQECAKLYLSR